MDTVVPLVVAFGLLTGLTIVAGSRFERWVTDGPARRRRFLGQRLRHPRRAAGAPAEPQRRPIQGVAADLRRLSRQLALVPSGAPLVRWKALWAAYDEVLMEAAELLDVPHDLRDQPVVGMPRDIERLRLLTALESAGLVVHG